MSPLCFYTIDSMISLVRVMVAHRHLQLPGTFSRICLQKIASSIRAFPVLDCSTHEQRKKTFQPKSIIIDLNIVFIDTNWLSLEYLDIVLSSGKVIVENIDFFDVGGLVKNFHPWNNVGSTSEKSSLADSYSDRRHKIDIRLLKYREYLDVK